MYLSMLTAKFQSGCVEKHKEAIDTIEQSASADRPVMGFGRSEGSESAGA